MVGPLCSEWSRDGAAAALSKGTVVTSGVLDFKLTKWNRGNRCSSYTLQLDGLRGSQPASRPAELKQAFILRKGKS